MALKSLISTSSSSLLQPSMPSLLQPSQISKQKHKSKKKGLCFIPQLCGIAEDETLETASSTQSITTQLKLLLNPKLNANATEFVPSFPQEKSADIDGTTFTYKKIEKFLPKHKPRAKLNIYIGKPETRRFLSQLHESFPNTSTLYFYLDVSTAFQMNDKQMHIFQTVKEPMISFINFDLHKKETQELLYGIVTPNDKNRIQKCNTHSGDDIKNTKWLWKMDQLLTATEIYETYGIKCDDLPKSSRKMLDMPDEEDISCDILSTLDWKDKNITQIGKIIKKSSRIKKLKVDLTVKNWIKKCNESWDVFPAIPIIAYENKDISGFDYWVEWVKLIKVKVDDEHESYIGISFKKYDTEIKDGSLWKLQSVFLNKIDMLNKHRLFGCIPSNYGKYFDKFDITITEIEWL